VLNCSVAIPALWCIVLGKSWMLVSHYCLGPIYDQPLRELLHPCFGSFDIFSLAFFPDLLRHRIVRFSFASSC
jgi:hypothetical protein